MDDMIKDQLVVMAFPISNGEEADRNEIVKALLERKNDVKNTFANDEFLMIDLTHQELVGMKSTLTLGKMPIGDLPALNYVISHSENYKERKILNLGKVSTIYKHHSM